MAKGKKPACFKDLVGQVFGRLTVLADTGKRNGNGNVWWSCLCDCGTVVERIGRDLRVADTPSCGCAMSDYRRGRPLKHGGAKTREWKIWNAMRRRCQDKNFRDYPHYGGRGISFSEEWKDFANFRADMGPCPEGHTLERLDSDGHYTAQNCVWADRKQQANNIRRNRKLTFQGETKTMAQWAEDPRVAAIGVNYTMLRARLNILKWTVEKALTTPKQANQYQVHSGSKLSAKKVL